MHFSQLQFDPQVKHLVFADTCNLVKLIDVFLLYKLLKDTS